VLYGASLVELESAKHLMTENKTWQKVVEQLKSVDLLLPIARKQVEQGKYQEATVTFAQYEKTLKDKTNTIGFDENPFFVGFEKGNLFTKNTTLNQSQFLAEMIRLQSKTDANSLYKLACGQYNLSYWGNSWFMIKHYKSVGDIEPISSNNQAETQNYNTDYFKQTLAKTTFTKALAKTNNHELKARILYGLALIEANEFFFYMAQTDPTYTSDYSNYNEYQKKIEAFTASVPNVRKKYIKNLSVIYDKYSHTQFSEMLLEECATYSFFMASTKE
jgi:hypothetical protein